MTELPIEIRHNMKLPCCENCREYALDVQDIRLYGGSIAVMECGHLRACERAYGLGKGKIEVEDD